MFYARPHRADSARHATLADLWNFSPAATQCTDDVDDAGLIALARRGDAVAFSRLFASFERAIFRYATHMCGRDAADDVVQETFLAVLRGANPSTSLRAGGYDPSRGTVGNYLFGIARHFVLKRLNAREIGSFDLDEHEEHTAWADDKPSVLDSLSREETVQAVRAAIASLPARYREVVVLCELQEMSYADAAAVVQCPVGTVRSRLHRARALLTTKLAAAHVEVGLRK